MDRQLVGNAMKSNIVEFIMFLSLCEYVETACRFDIDDWSVMRYSSRRIMAPLWNRPPHQTAPEIPLNRHNSIKSTDKKFPV